MMPPIRRRCPDCGHAGWRHRFEFVETDNAERRVACPACEHRFEPVEHPWVN